MAGVCIYQNSLARKFLSLENFIRSLFHVKILQSPFVGSIHTVLVRRKRSCLDLYKPEWLSHICFFI